MISQTIALTLELERILQDLEEAGLEVVRVGSDVGRLVRSDFNLDNNSKFHRHFIDLKGGLCLAVVSRIRACYDVGWPTDGRLYFSVCDVLFLWSSHGTPERWFNWQVKSGRVEMSNVTGGQRLDFVGGLAKSIVYRRHFVLLKDGFHVKALEEVESHEFSIYDTEVCSRDWSKLLNCLRRMLT